MVGRAAVRDGRTSVLDHQSHTHKGQSIEMVREGGTKEQDEYGRDQAGCSVGKDVFCHTREGVRRKWDEGGQGRTFRLEVWQLRQDWVVRLRLRLR